MKVKRVPVETDIDILHKKSSVVDMTDTKLVNRLEAILMSTFLKLDGKAQGLSAIQCGEAYRAILLRYEKGKDPIVVYNPTIKFKFGNRKSNEGCLSEGDGRYIVRRPILSCVTYTTIDGITVTEWLDFKKSRIFCHECDHLDGILLQDKGKKIGD